MFVCHWNEITYTRSSLLSSRLAKRGLVYTNLLAIVDLTNKLTKKKNEKFKLQFWVNFFGQNHEAYQVRVRKKTMTMLYFWSFSFGVLILASAEKEKLDRNSITQPVRNYKSINVFSGEDTVGSLRTLNWFQNINSHNWVTLYIY